MSTGDLARRLKVTVELSTGSTIPARADGGEDTTTVRTPDPPVGP
jgi:hypothetical protein